MCRRLTCRPARTAAVAWSGSAARLPRSSQWRAATRKPSAFKRRPPVEPAVLVLGGEGGVAADAFADRPQVLRRQSPLPGRSGDLRQVGHCRALPPPAPQPARADPVRCAVHAAADSAPSAAQPPSCSNRSNSTADNALAALTSFSASSIAAASSAPSTLLTSSEETDATREPTLSNPPRSPCAKLYTIVVASPGSFRANDEIARRPDDVHLIPLVGHAKLAALLRLLPPPRTGAAKTPRPGNEVSPSRPASGAWLDSTRHVRMGRPPAPAPGDRPRPAAGERPAWSTTRPTVAAWPSNHRPRRGSSRRPSRPTSTAWSGSAPTSSRARCWPPTGSACSPCRSAGASLALVVARPPRHPADRRPSGLPLAAPVVRALRDPGRQRLRGRGRRLRRSPAGPRLDHPGHPPGLRRRSTSSAGPTRSRRGRDGELVGGLYGVGVGGLFAGESMFHRATDASKVALVALVGLLDAHPDTLVDVQWATPHLGSLGVVEIPRRDYLRRLARAVRRRRPPAAPRRRRIAAAAVPTRPARTMSGCRTTGVIAGRGGTSPG